MGETGRSFYSFMHAFNIVPRPATSSDACDATQRSAKLSQRRGILVIILRTASFKSYSFIHSSISSEKGNSPLFPNTPHNPIPLHHLASSPSLPRGAADPLTAVTSISIFISSLMSPAEIIVAAGRALPNHLFSTGQTRGNASRSGTMYVTRTTSSTVAPASRSADAAFRRHCSACATMSGDSAPVL